jgi:hypothetical protein
MLRLGMQKRLFDQFGPKEFRFIGFYRLDRRQQFLIDIRKPTFDPLGNRAKIAVSEAGPKKEKEAATDCSSDKKAQREGSCDGIAGLSQSAQ